MSTVTSAEADALRVVNRLRVTRGSPALLHMPLGYRNNGAECPIKRALGPLFPYSVVGTNLADFFHLSLSDKTALHGFIREFDGGNLPHLDLALAKETMDRRHIRFLAHTSVAHRLQDQIAALAEPRPVAGPHQTFTLKA